MSRSTRRRFLVTSAACAAGLAQSPSILFADKQLTAGKRRPAASQIKDTSPRSFRITGIERHEVLIPYHDYNAKTLFRYHGLGIQLRTIFIAKTNTGLEGYGEAWGRGWPKGDELTKYVGTNPFDWIGDETNLPINMAMYDLMGKHLGLPVWKLIGPKVRNWIPVAAWTVSQPPEAMAEEVQSVARRGYRWLKYHIDEIQNVVDQTAAMQKAAPQGFKIHYDFNENSNIEAVLPVLKELERFPIASRIEDPIVTSERDGYRLLRERVKLPILIHHGPVDFMTDHLCDGLMAGHAPIGKAAKVAAVAESTNTPFMLQQAGGTINQAFLAHEVAVFKMATLDQVNLCHLWKDDVTIETMPVVKGSVQVPTGPGLGITLDREKLERYKQAPRPRYEPFLVRIRYEDGLTIYTRHDADQPKSNDSLRFLSRLLKQNVPGPLPAYANPVVSEFLDKKNFADFEKIWQQTKSGPFVVNRG